MLLPGIISERLYNYLEETKTMPHKQKGCRRKCRGTRDQQNVDAEQQEKKNQPEYGMDRLQDLSMAWIDYKKAFSMKPHS